MPERAPERLHRKLRWVFVMQAFIASLVMALGLLYGGAWLRDRMMRDRMESEAAHLWDVLAGNPRVQLTSGMGFDTRLVPVGAAGEAELPAEMRGFSTGFHRVGDGPRLAYVSERGGKRLVLTVLPQAANRIVLYNTLLALLLGIACIAVLARLGYRSSKAAVAPVGRLADAMVRWDPLVPHEHEFDEVEARAEPVAEVEQLRASLRTVAGRMREYIERERDFTRDASHELRTPLTVVRVATDLLGQEQQLSERGARSLRRLGNAVREMEELLDAFLVLARHPDVPLDMDDIDLAEVAHEQVAIALPLLEGKPVALGVVEHAQPRVQAPLRVPGVLLGQLLRNACEHTDAGRIEVRIEADRIEVEDSGAGMDAATLARAFQPFFRGNESAAGSKGLGLHVVQRLAERLGWNVDLRSSPGAGTTATVRFAG
ncbi:HAMP domain-containing histidine kinase [Pseudoluteimonas lycopersici]|uniref:histidine kinase n=1 Tax=Pseudoluteimonas lycopersici TaxID=1324796 RepID=A0A516V7W0_9GAMM|nr:HAMP domain-containing sensor histidine kinase [Lysobacter lycopersici]QDQ74600.1 HAMP domain-containing histidine kinase [Lysobacter lycopersici]